MRFARLFLIAIFAVAALLLPSLASADGITWTLEDVALNDGGFVTGAFNYNATTNSFSAIDLTSTSGSLLNGMNYTTLTPPFFSTSTLLGVGPATIPSGGYTGLTFLELFFTNPLTNSGGTDSVYAVETFCANSNCSTYTKRTSTSGYVTTNPAAAPEPASLLLLVSGLLALFLSRPRP
jgi:hypothetical protein